MEAYLRNLLLVFGSFLTGLSAPILTAGGQISPNCPGEKILVHLSHESAFTGEICWFKIYCSQEQVSDGTFSNLAFLELVGRNNTALVRKKVLLDHGEGTGDFVIPDNIPTGLYSILVYTRWMKNFGEQTFFKKGLVIINPNQNTPLAPDSIAPPVIHESMAGAGKGQDLLQVIPDKRNYATRERVSLSIKPLTDAAGSLADSYSVSVYRKEKPLVAETVTSSGVEEVPDPSRMDFLPDYKGILLSGRAEDPTGKPVAGCTVVLSIPGPGVALQSSVTDCMGNFHFLLKAASGEKDVVIAMSGAIGRINLEDPFWNGYREPPGNMVLHLDPITIQYLKEKYTLHQLQQRFRQPVKRQPPGDVPDSAVFYIGPVQTIEMKKYISLDSLREYFYELLPSVKFIQRRNDLEISMVDPRTLSYIAEKPGVFLDGVPYDNYQAIFGIPSDNIKRVSVLPLAYYYRDLAFGGIIDIHTERSDFSSVPLMPNMMRFRLNRADDPGWKFNPPDYAREDSLERIPDFRHLLDWQPSVGADDSGTATARFFTGDLGGQYVVRVMGRSRNGGFLQAESEFVVDGAAY